MSETTVINKEGFGIFAKLMFGFLLIIILTGIAEYYSVVQMNRLSELSKKIYNHPLQVTRAVLSADSNIVKIHRSMKDVALARTNTELVSATELVNEYEKLVYSHLDIVEKWILGNEGATLEKETAQLFRDWKPIRDEVITLTKTGKTEEAFAITKGKGADHVEKLNHKMEELKNYAAQKASGMLRDSQMTRASVVRTTTLFMLLIFLAAFSFGFLFSRSITKTIDSLINGIEEFAKGNLDFEIRTKSKDELGWIAKALTRMASQRKKTLEEINLQSEILRNMAEGVNLVRTENGIIAHANPKLENMFGYNSGEMNGKHVSFVNAPTDKNPEETASEIMKEINETGTWSGEVHNIKKDGTAFWCNVNVSIFDHPVYGKVMISVHSDITKRKQLENELLEHKSSLEKTIKARTFDLKEEILAHKRTTAFLSEVFQNTDTGIFVVDVINENDFVYAGINPTHEKLVGGIPNEWIVGKTPNDLIKYFNKEEIELVYHLYRRCVTEKQTIILEHPVVINKEETWWLSKITPLIDNQGNTYRLIGTGIQITDRKKAEEQIKESLKEKETLLHEIHHRVKNNMQIIASLLDMQLKQKDEQNVESIIKESKGRVYAMAAIHESLHQSEKLSEIDLNAYVHQLSRLLPQTFIANPERVSFDIEIPEINLAIDKANPLGLGLNELISNSLKYAFPDDQKGTIKITASIKNDDIVELVVSDDGVGMPDNFDWEKTNTLGLRLVKDLVERQLNGSLEHENQNGTQFTIKFNLDSDYKS